MAILSPEQIILQCVYILRAKRKFKHTIKVIHICCRLSGTMPRPNKSMLRENQWVEMVWFMKSFDWYKHKKLRESGSETSNGWANDINKVNDKFVVRSSMSCYYKSYACVWLGFVTPSRWIILVQPSTHKTTKREREGETRA